MKNVLLYWSQSHEAGVGALREGHSSFDTCRHKETHITVILKRYPIIIKNDPKNIPNHNQQWSYNGSQSWFDNVKELPNRGQNHYTIIIFTCLFVIFCHMVRELCCTTCGSFWTISPCSKVIRLKVSPNLE